MVNENLKAMPIADRIIKDFYGRIVNSVERDGFSFGKELQLHVLEVRSNNPFESPMEFEETMQRAVLELLSFLGKRYRAKLLGAGMHPLLRIEETDVWPHRHRQIYEAYGKIFNLKQHGWLNIQSFQLNIPYFNEGEAILMHNALANICAYLPAISASSPIYEGRIGEYVDNRLRFYVESQKEVPSITGRVIPEYASSFKQYKEEVIERYSQDLARAGADKCLLYKEWVNSRGVILRFERKTLEIRVMDEQECIRSDVALSCFIRSLLKAFRNGTIPLLPTELLVNDFNSIVKDGLNAKVLHPEASTARGVCRYLFKMAWMYASPEEKKYLGLVARRIEEGSLSEALRREVVKKAQRMSLPEATLNVYLNLVKSLEENKPFF